MPLRVLLATVLVLVGLLASCAGPTFVVQQYLMTLDEAFEAEPGKVYRVAFTPAARIFEVDRGADTVGRDATNP